MAKQSKAARPLTHAQVWAALDRLAERAGLSPSGLAKQSGLDPTTFNKSKRVTGDGRERWPSTESLSKALAASNASMETFVQLLGDGPRGGQSVPLLGFAQAGAGGYFDDSGFPAGKGWDEVALPATSDEHAYALEIDGDSMKPAYREGDIIVVSPATAIRRGDRGEGPFQPQPRAEQHHGRGRAPRRQRRPRRGAEHRKPRQHRAVRPRSAQLGDDVGVEQVHHSATGTGRRRARPRGGSSRSVRASSDSSNCFSEGRAACCRRRHSCMGTSTAASAPRRVTSCGPSDRQASRNSLKRAFASCTGQACMSISDQTS